MTKESQKEVSSLVSQVFRNVTTRENIQKNIFQSGESYYNHDKGIHEWVPTGAPQDNGETKETTKE